MVAKKTHKATNGTFLVLAYQEGTASPVTNHRSPANHKIYYSLVTFSITFLLITSFS